MQRLKQAGMVREGDIAYTIEVPPDCVGMPGSVGEPFERDGKHWASMPHIAEFTHWPRQQGTVVDDMLKNERKEGQF